MGITDRISGLKTEAQIKMMNKGLQAFLKGVKWTPSQAKLIRIQMVMNELEGKQGHKVFESGGSIGKISSATGKKMNEAGAKEYIDRIKAIVDE